MHPVSGISVGGKSLRMARLVQAKRKATVTQITMFYNSGMQKSISEHNTLNREVNGLQQQKINKSKNKSRAY